MSTLQVLSQAIRPLVWEKGLWSGELEKAWTHLFDIVACLMKLGYPHEYQVQQNARLKVLDGNLEQTVFLFEFRKKIFNWEQDSKKCIKIVLKEQDYSKNKRDKRKKEQN